MVKAEFPIGKTQWRKWSDAQRGAFNQLRKEGMPHDEAVKEAGRTGWIELKPKVVFPEEPVEVVVKPAEPAKKPAAPKKRTAPSMKAK